MNSVREHSELGLRIILISLGFKIHPTKSVLTPTQTLVFWGYEINTVNMTVKPTTGKIAKFIEASDHILNKPSTSIREVASLVGLMVDYTKGVQYAAAHYRMLEADKIRALARNKGNLDSQMTLSEQAKEDIWWWRHKLPSSMRKIR